MGLSVVDNTYFLAEGLFFIMRVNAIVERIPNWLS